MRCHKILIKAITVNNSILIRHIKRRNPFYEKASKYVIETDNKGREEWAWVEDILRILEENS